MDPRNDPESLGEALAKAIANQLADDVVGRAQESASQYMTSIVLRIPNLTPTLIDILRGAYLIGYMRAFRTECLGMTE